MKNKSLKKDTWLVVERSMNHLKLDVMQGWTGSDVMVRHVFLIALFKDIKN